MDQETKALASIETSYVITRADGTVEDLGVTGYWHRNPIKRWAWKLRHQRAADRRIAAANLDAAHRAASTAEEA